MKIFLTGATGYIGSAVACHLIEAGHQVRALARSRDKAAALAEAGVTAVLGDLREPASYEATARGCDAILHAGFEYGPGARLVDRNALDALARAARAGRGPRTLVYTSGVWVLGPSRGGPADETARLAPPAIVAWRPEHEAIALEAAGGEVTALVLRPGCVYGERGGLYGRMLQSLFDSRVIRVVGDGSNRWAAVYLDDLAEFYRLLVEKRPPSGVYHATDGSSDAVRAVAEAFADAAGGGSVEETPLEVELRTLGPIAEALAMDQTVSSEKARRELGWKPAVVSAARNATALLREWHEKLTGLCVA